MMDEIIKAIEALPPEQRTALFERFGVKTGEVAEGEKPADNSEQVEGKEATEPAGDKPATEGEAESADPDSDAEQPAADADETEPEIGEAEASPALAQEETPQYATAADLQRASETITAFEARVASLENAIQQLNNLTLSESSGDFGASGMGKSVPESQPEAGDFFNSTVRRLGGKAN